MKNLLSIALIALVFVATSCSKESKLNRKIDGEWTMTKVNGVAPEAGSSLTLKFEKDKKGTGAFTMTNAGDGYSYTETGTYTLTEDESITMTYTGGTTSNLLTVTDYSKTLLKLKSTDGTETYEYEFEKK